ncbi:MAG: polymer-forming cytoskeletal protein [Thermoanaerobaculia bacterium]|nr:polymer-forming cytoskeletal protein [Thermoanaerobaculia bacterium]
MIFKSDRSRGDLNGFVDAGSHLEGTLRFDDTFRVDGRVTGKVLSDGDLVIGERGEVEGELRVGRIFVSGKVRGSIRAAQRVELAAGARLHGDVETPVLVIEEGAFFEGRCSMERARSERGGVVRPMPLSTDG